MPRPRPSFALSILLLLSAAGPAASRADAPAFLRAWGSGGNGPSQFSFAHHLTVAPSGDVYVGDLLNDRVQRFSSTGVYLGQWPCAGADGIAAAPDGSLYVVAGDHVAHFSAIGASLGAWGSTGSADGQFNFAIDVAVDADGDVYVGEAGGHRVQKFTADGTFVTKWGSQGVGDGQFEFLVGMSVTPRGEVLVTDVAGNQVQRFTRDGVFLQRWGSTGAGALSGPGRAVADADGNVVVPDGSHARVSVFSIDGGYKFSWGSAGSATGEFNGPSCIGLGAAGEVYVMDKDNARVQEFANVATATARESWGGVKRRYH